MRNPEYSSHPERAAWQMKLRDAAMNPVSGVTLFMECIVGNEDKDHYIEIDNLTLERTRLFLFDVKEALIHANTKYRLIPELRRDIYGRRQSETVFEHEYAHAKKASELLKRRFKESKMNAAFGLMGEELGVVLEFVPPPLINPIDFIFITLAPTNINEFDRLCVDQLVGENADLLRSKPDTLQEIASQYEAKTIFTFNYNF